MLGLLTHRAARNAPAKTVAGASVQASSANENKSLQPYIAPIGALCAASDVRLALAGRLVTLLPSLNEEKYTLLYAYTVKTMGTLALDEVLKIRLALSSTLKDQAFVPPKVAEDLSREMERDVSEPILRFCAAVSDPDLLEILCTYPAHWVAPTERPIPPLTSMPAESLGNIVRESRKIEEDKIPKPESLNLPDSIARHLSELIDASVRDLLLNRGNFDRHTTEEITEVFRRRLNLMKSDDLPATVDDDAITDALALRKTARVFEGLARLLKIDKANVVEIFETRSAKSIVALCWKAGLSMRTALTLQRDLGLVSAARLIYPKGGIDYPFPREEMIWHLEFLGLSKA